MFYMVIFSSIKIRSTNRFYNTHTIIRQFLCDVLRMVLVYMVGQGRLFITADVKASPMTIRSFLTTVSCLAKVKAVIVHTDIAYIYINGTFS